MDARPLASHRLFGIRLQLDRHGFRRRTRTWGTRVLEASQPASERSSVVGWSTGSDRPLFTFYRHDSRGTTALHDRAHAREVTLVSRDAVSRARARAPRRARPDIPDGRRFPARGPHLNDDPRAFRTLRGRRLRAQYARRHHGHARRRFSSHPDSRHRDRDRCRRGHQPCRGRSRLALCVQPFPRSRRFSARRYRRNVLGLDADTELGPSPACERPPYLRGALSECRDHEEHRARIGDEGRCASLLQRRAPRDSVRRKNRSRRLRAPSQRQDRRFRKRRRGDTSSHSATSRCCSTRRPRARSSLVSAAA